MNQNQTPPDWDLLTDRELEHHAQSGDAARRWIAREHLLTRARRKARQAAQELTAALAKYPQ